MSRRQAMHLNDHPSMRDSSEKSSYLQAGVAKFKGRKFVDLNESDRQELLKLVAIRLGIIDG